MKKMSVISLIGGSAYVLTEILWRGRSHWTMFILGGICFLLIGMINEIIPWEMPLWKQGLMSSIIVTSLEFITGMIVNVLLSWNVWDYSTMPLNLLGQICLPFSLIWIVLGVVGVILDDWIRYLIFREERPHYHFF